ncbi:trypsin-like peptidase domain-containing protein [Streptomyces sp. G-G2]|uniref:trypsin-like serine peptidase n=1 Tax=Streptomyces sp. G-G2 TaxID=3046201 RepID=UPI0024B9249A|nr:trypsin-like peptidase domain-containing protein [Streptomyces sp. G-G2]MDJ0381218.1 trypsin-like peptidase domain-containing protein [Streptomyces sp. G-G2]
MIQRMFPRQALRARRAARVVLAMAAMSALLTVDIPDASAAPPLGVTAQAPVAGSTQRVGALFTAGPDGGHYCTASVVRSDGHDVIATAAHCLGDVQNTVFVPGYRDGTAPYGAWQLTGQYVDPSWQDGQDPDADISFATVAPLNGRQIEDVVGGFPVLAEQPDDVTVTIVGYPAGDEVPLVCSNDTTMLSPTQRRVDCPELASGTSGSPWLADGALAGVLGGYQAGGEVDDVSYSAVMGDTAQELYREAAGRAADQGVHHVTRDASWS